jgi:4-amino-4-deoxy-L-arabinose transferase-like glycosyltransferase
MSATTFTDTRGRGGHRARLSERWAFESWVLPTILVVAGLNFFWQLGSSSYFIDEAFSVIHSLPALHTVFNLIIHQKNGETTPPTYFLFLHEWILRTGSQAEWVTRLPSAVAGLALVAATYWMAMAFLARRVALAAAALCALSPLILSYAQETRAYVFVVLACVVCVGATVRASQRSEGRTRMLIVGALAAVLAVWLHYIAVSVLVPLLIWVAARSELTRRQRLCFIGVCLAGTASVLPILLDQYHNYVGGAISGSINWTNVVSVTGTPFGARVGTPVDLRTLAGALVCLVAVLVLLVSRPGEVRHRHLLAALGAFGILALIGVDLTGKSILITRYTTVSAPFLLTAIAAACAILPRPGAAALAALALAAAIAGVIDDHSSSGFYAPVRDAVKYIEPRVQPDEFLLSPGFPLTDTPIFYYDTRLLRPKLQFFGLQDSRVPLAFRTHTRVWIIDNPPRATTASALAGVERILSRNRWHAVSVRVFPGSIDLGVLLTVPDSKRHAAARA